MLGTGKDTSLPLNVFSGVQTGGAGGLPLELKRSNVQYIASFRRNFAPGVTAGSWACWSWDAEAIWLLYEPRLKTIDASRSISIIDHAAVEEILRSRGPSTTVSTTAESVL